MIDPRVREFLDRPRTAGLTDARLTPLAGEASNRLYYRVHPREGESRILALLPSAFDPEELPFLDSGKLFAAIPLRVPAVFEVAADLGILLLEDLGDLLLQEAVGGECAPARKQQLYRKSVSMLAVLQRRGDELLRSGHEFRALRAAFDAEKFTQELQFFRAHFLEGYSGARLAEREAKALDRELSALAVELAGQPYALCHRDYHARNLLVCGEEIAVIDHQDARLGPRCYDLASLLNDSYVAHEPRLVAEMKELFRRETDADVPGEYAVAALQRNLKALGTFGFQIDARGNDVYRQYIPHTLSLVRADLDAAPRWDRLRALLAAHLPELG
jgi:aminoglycoside/choline kinase family phosphotransferase